MEMVQPAFSRQSRPVHLLHLHPGLPHLSSDLIRPWRLRTASKPVRVRNTCSRRILRCALTICLFMELNCLERLTSICYLRLSSRLRMPRALVFQIRCHNKLGEKSFHLDGSTLGLATFIYSRILLVRP